MSFTLKEKEAIFRERCHFLLGSQNCLPILQLERFYFGGKLVIKEKRTLLTRLKKKGIIRKQVD